MFAERNGQNFNRVNICQEFIRILEQKNDICMIFYSVGSKNWVRNMVITGFGSVYQWLWKLTQLRWFLCGSIFIGEEGGEIGISCMQGQNIHIEKPHIY